MGYGNGKETTNKQMQNKHQKHSITMEKTKHTIYDVSNDTSPSNKVSYH